MTNMGFAIKDLRIKQGLTLEQLGKRCGVGKSTVRKWETGEIQNMRRDKIEKVAKALGVSVEYFFLDEDVPVYDGPRSSAEEDFSDMGLYVTPTTKKLFQTLKGATDDEIEQAIKIIEALRK